MKVISLSVRPPHMRNRLRVPRSLLLVLFILVIQHSANRTAQAQDIPEVSERLYQGVDNPEPNQNRYRGGAGSIAEVLENMTKIAAPGWAPKPQPKHDQYLNPHLKDLNFTPQDRQEQAYFRSRAGLQKRVPCPFIKGAVTCLNGLAENQNQTACIDPACQIFPCNIPWPHPEHLTPKCCTPTPGGTSIYKSLVTDSNFKTCCVRDGTIPSVGGLAGLPNAAIPGISGGLAGLIGGVAASAIASEVLWTEEEIACTHPYGDGWAGMFELYYPTTIIGVENQRAETMIASKEEVQSCRQRVLPMMKSQQTAKHVAGALDRLEKFSDPQGANASQGTSPPNSDPQLVSEVLDNLQNGLPTDEKLQFADSISGGGITVRPFLPAYDRAAMLATAVEYCMHPMQLFKLMDPMHDPLQHPVFGGASALELAKKVPIWANYCPEFFEVLTDTSSSNMANFHDTPTDFIKGMALWNQNPLYCQNVNVFTNLSFALNPLSTAVLRLNPMPLSPEMTGFTCWGGGALAGGVVPLNNYRHASIVRRTAFEHGLAAATAAGLFLTDGGRGRSENNKMPRTAYKGFEWQPYSMTADLGNQLFWGKQFKGLPGGPTNELKMPCRPIQGNNYSNMNNSDQFMVSDVTHEPFSTKPILNVNGSQDAYYKSWFGFAKDRESIGSVPGRELDDKASNYGITYRQFAVCPLGFKPWDPRDPHGLLKANLATNCGVENFGSPRAHTSRPSIPLPGNPSLVPGGGAIPGVGGSIPGVGAPLRGLPGLGGAINIPGLPGLPSLPSLPGLPGLPGFPGIPAIPGLPALPNISIPGISAPLPNISIPSLPQIPQMPNMPQAPAFRVAEAGATPS